jgi:glycosyltransferase involved in cell wall biosynthesis
MNGKLEEVARLLKPVPLSSLPATPLVSVIVANYNYANYVGQAIESVLQQTYGNFELCICDDGSTDNSREVINRYVQEDSRVRLTAKSNGGMASALNAAYSESKGEIICLLDSDDRFMPRKLEEVVSGFEEDANSGFLVHRVIRMEGNGLRRGAYPVLAQLPFGWYGGRWVKDEAEPPSMPPCSGLCLRREIADRIFPISEQFRSYADGVVQCLAPLMTPVIGISNPLAEWRVHGGNLTTTSSITHAHLVHDLKTTDLVWVEQRRYLEGISPELARMCSPLGDRAAGLTKKYMRARLGRDGTALTAYRKLVRSNGFQSLPFLVRIFWTTSILLPGFLFQKAINRLLGASRLKRWVWNVVERSGLGHNLQRRRTRTA